MNIVGMLRKEFIIPLLKAKNKREVIEELSSAFLKIHHDLDLGAMTGALLSREKLGSTGIGEGVAIPHGKIAGLDKIILSFGRSSEGIPFNALDGKPVHLFFLLMAPEGSTSQHLKVLAKISRMLKDGEFRNALMSADTAENIYRIIEEKDRTESA
ncbi:MAG: PTS sugar transporter subunit IIA [Syntrophales bacterium]